MKTKGDFTHRQNGDGTVDSICLHCFRTVGTAENIEGLDASEKHHICDGGIRPATLNDSEPHHARLILVPNQDQ
jgi:hypothetical protein